MTERPLAEARRVGLIGDPVAHSLSPALQQPAFDALGIAARYELWPTAALALPERVATLRAPEMLGANVTVPHKQAVLGLLDVVSEQARRAGAVNTIINRNGRLHGDNTDIAGFAMALVAVCFDAKDREVLLLGAGGAARGVILALETLGVRQIAVTNRHHERARRLAAEVTPTQINVVASNEAELESALRQARLIVNATSLGWHAGETPLALSLLEYIPADALVVDLTYRDTDLLLAARARGLPTLDGLPMLIHQGARAFQLWTGQLPPLELMRDGVQQAWAARESAT